MTLQEAIATGKPFKHKKDTWAYEKPQSYMLKAISNDWEVVDEISKNQLCLIEFIDSLDNKRNDGWEDWNSNRSDRIK